MERDCYGQQNWDTILQTFDHLKGSTYLDHAGSALYSQSQLTNVFQELSKNLFGNPHSRNPSSSYCSELIDKVRREVLSFFNADPDVYDLIFTCGATESFRLVAENFQFLAANGESSGTFVYLKESHTSVVGMRQYTLKNHISTYALPSDAALKQLKGVSNYPDGNLDYTCDQRTQSLFVYPAQCNFSGYKYPLEWIQQCQHGALDVIDALNNDEYCLNKKSFEKTINQENDWYCMLDASSYVSTHQLDLSQWQPDFVALSFYKIFGYPTGLGALIVHQRAQHTLKPTYFGGGTVEMFSSATDLHIPRRVLHERFENGTVNFLSIISLHHSINAIKAVATMEQISTHTFNLAHYLYHSFLDLKHFNGKNLVEMYSNNFDDRRRQGAIISFNLKNAQDEYIGYAQVEKTLALYNIHVRTGCFCNPAACQRYLRLTDDDIKNHHMLGHSCGDENDIMCVN